MKLLPLMLFSLIFVSIETLAYPPKCGANEKLVWGNFGSSKCVKKGPGSSFPPGHPNNLFGPSHSSPSKTGECWGSKYNEKNPVCRRITERRSCLTYTKPVNSQPWIVGGPGGKPGPTIYPCKWR